MFACVIACHVCRGDLGGQRRGSDGLELELQAAIGHLTLVLGAKPKSSGRAAGICNCWAQGFCLR